MKKRISAIFLFCACPALVLAQADLPNPPGQEVVKVVRVHGNASNIANAAGSYSGAHYTVSNELNAIVIRGKPETVASVERTIQELDALNTATPAKRESTRDFELTAYVVGGSNEAVPGSEDISGEALAPVIKQLHAIFPYKHYSLLVTMLLRSAQGSGAGSRGIMPAPSGPTPSSYLISFDTARISSEGGQVDVHLGNFRFEAQVSYKVGSSSFQTSPVSVGTDVDLRDSQKLVVGKANVGNSDSCFFIVLSARLGS